MNETIKLLMLNLIGLNENVEQMAKFTELGLPENIFFQGLLEFLVYVALIDNTLTSREIEVISSFTQREEDIKKIKSMINDTNRFKNDIPLYIQTIMLLDILCRVERKLINTTIEAYEIIGYNMMENGSIKETRNLNGYRNLIVKIKKYVNDNYEKFSVENAEVAIRHLVAELEEKELVFELIDSESIASLGDNIENHKSEDQKIEKEYESEENTEKASENTIKNDKNQKDNLQELLNNLNSYIGLNKVKEEIKSLVNLIEIRNKRNSQGLKNPDMSFHLCFMGNPGTGKTTVARIVSKIYKELGILSKGHLIEVARNDLVGGYVGQTAIKTKEIIKKAYGGVLFIDEAYSLTNKGNENDFGQEAIEVLLKEMEDNRSDLVVIVAGYTDLMNDFLTSNPGLQSRFNVFIDFEDYSPEELVEIIKLQCKNNDYVIDSDCEEYLLNFMKNECMSKKEDFANARFARNVFENAIKRQSTRLTTVNDFDKENLRKLAKEDFIV